MEKIIEECIVLKKEICELPKCQCGAWVTLGFGSNEGLFEFLDFLRKNKRLSERA